MRPILFHVLGYPVHSFGVMVALALLAGLWWTQAEARRVGRDERLFVDVFWRVALAGVLGARLLYVAVHPEVVAGPHGWLAIFEVWRGGLVLYGGLAAAIGVGLVFVAIRREPLLASLDLSMPGTWLGLAIGRIGCYLVGDDWGKPTDAPWAVVFPPDPHSELAPELVGTPLHPTQLYDSLNGFLLFLLAAVLLRLEVKPGRVAGITLAGYAVLRFQLEYVRGDDGPRGAFALPGTSLTLFTSQWISIATFVIGIVLVLAVSGRARGPACAAAD